MQLTARLLHTPEGFRDIYNGECRDENAAEEKIMSVLHLSGFEDVRTPGLEYSDVFSKERGTVPCNEMYRFFDSDGNTLALRPDITPAIARLASRYFSDVTEPVRFCYNERTYRNTPGLRGQLKEINQTGVELIGDPSVMADADVIVAAVKSLLAVGMREFQVEIGSAAFLNSIMSPLSLADEDMDELRRIIDNKNRYALLDFLDARENLIPENKRNVLSGVTEDFGTMQDILTKKSLDPVFNDPAFARTKETINRLIELDKLIEMYGLSDYIRYDLGMIGKLGYYTGIILRGYTYGSGRTILSGGRYDNLVSQFGKNAPAVGMAIEMDELMSSLMKNDIHPYNKEKCVTIVAAESMMQEAIRLRLSYMAMDRAAVIITDNRIHELKVIEGEK